MAESPRLGNRVPTLAFAALNAVMALGVVLPYVLHNQVGQWDASGHLFSAWYTKEYLFPRPTGWDPLFFAGFPQGTLYPFLFHYLVAALAFVVPLLVAFKLVLGTAILATPLAFYYFCRGFDFEPAEGAAASIWMSAILVLPIEFATDNNYVGGTFASTFRIGLVANAFALPLLFLYAGSLLRGLRTQRLVMPTLLLATLVLSHIMTALVGILFTVFLAVLHARDPRTIRYLVVHSVLALALTAFWAAPFVLYSGYSDSVRLPLYLGRGAFVILGIGLATLAWLHSRRSLEGITVLAAWFLTLVIAVLLSSSLPVRLHFYRFVLYPVLLVPVLLARVVPRRYVGALAVGGLVSFFLSVVAPPPGGLKDAFSGPRMKPPRFLAAAPRGRTIVVANNAEQPDPGCVHVLQHAVPMQLGIAASKGLFVESAINARYFLSLEKLMDPWAMAWGVPSIDLGNIPESRRKAIVARGLGRLGVSSVISARTPRGLEYRARWPLMSSETPATFRAFEWNGVPRLVRTWGEKHYVSVEADTVVIVDDEVEGARYSVYAGRLPAGADRAALQTPDYTYFVEHMQQEIWTVDFLLPRSRNDGPGPVAVQRLRTEMRALPDSLPLKDLLLETLGDVESDLYEVSAAYAKQRYANSPVVDLAPLGETLVPADSEQVVNRPVRLKFDCYTLPDSDLVVIEPRGAMVASHTWDDLIMRWFLSPIAVDFIQKPFDGSVTGLGSVRDVRWDRTMEHIRFHVDSESPTLVKVKVSYFPKWHARVGGRSVPIYRITPNFMAVQAAGDVELNYEDSPIEVAGSVCSGLGVVLLLLLGVREMSRLQRS